MRLSEVKVSRLFDLQDTDQVFEKLIEECYRAELKPGDYAVDGGAHGGLHTIPMARCVGPMGRVIAFEPIPSICAWLAGNVESFPNVEVNQKALAEECGIATFRYLPREPWLSSLNVRGNESGKEVEEITVTLFALDNLAHFPIKFIKLDLEGAEFHAISGGKALIAKQSPVIAFECGRIDAARSAGYSAEEFFALFRDLDYEVRDLFGYPFGLVEFGLPWNDRTVPHYAVAAPSRRQDIFQRLQDEVNFMVT